MDVAGGQDPARTQQHQVVGQARHFLRRVADIDDRDVQFAVQRLDPRQDFLAALDVDRGQRLVHQQQARADGEGAGDGDALAFAAGQRVRFARHQRSDPQQGNGALQWYAPRRLRHPPQAVFQVAAHVEVVEQAGLLEHVADRPPVRGQELRPVLPGLAGHHQAAVGVAVEAGDGAQ